jgi:Protein of unknown function (DUF1553)/Protein of unknown function (DUF1549)
MKTGQRFRIPFRTILFLSLACSAMLAQEQAELAVNHSECLFLGPQREKFLKSGLDAERQREFQLGKLTAQVAAKLAPAAAVSRDANGPQGTIDKYLFQAMSDAGVNPADKSNDFEFIRRASLDLTGRVPDSQRVLEFVADDRLDKRSRLVDELVNTPEWVDKWTMYFGDLFKNTFRNTQVVRYNEGRNAFYGWIKSSLASNKNYKQMAAELITATGDNSYQQGELNWLIGGFVTGGPRTGQDNFDQQAANVAQTFLGIAHMNCILCHDGRRHLDSLNLWGKNATRAEGWQLASFFSRTTMNRVPVMMGAGNPYYWNVREANVADYPLNTTSGNRPTRAPIGSMRNVAPVYPFSGNSPAGGENYRVALAREVTSDFQFARAAVNYLWKEFFGKGLVEPVDQFDLARLDPDNPPPDPWTLQPSNPALLNALAQDFINNNYNLKALMRIMASSEAYQLSSRYDGEWKPSWENLFARKLVRRLWAEEIHDAIVQTSNVPVSYNIAGIGQVRWAMQFPEPLAARTVLLDAFFRGNRDNEERRPDGSSLQALSLMNDPFVMNRTRISGTDASPSLARKVFLLPDEQTVNTMYLTVLSRYPTDDEKKAAVSAFQSSNRQQRIEDLLWSLYNKVDFFFNY